MLTNKQRNFLRKEAHDLADIIYIGKEGINDEIIVQTRDALAARELIKGKLLQNAPIEVDEVANILAKETKCDVVCTIGNKFVLYKKNLKKTKIEIPTKRNLMDTAQKKKS